MGQVSIRGGRLTALGDQELLPIEKEMKSIKVSTSTAQTVISRDC